MLKNKKDCADVYCVNCFGYIDEIKFPLISGSAYFIYQKSYPVVLQGVADADKKFLVMEVGENGKQSDGDISQFFDLLEKNEFLRPT